MSPEHFTPAEAAAFVDLPERQIRKEVEHGLFSTDLGFQALVYLGALRQIGLELRVVDRRRLLAVVAREIGSRGKTPDVVALSEILMLRLGPVVRELRERVDRFNAWKETLVTDPEILAGEPVFPKSRLAVRHIGMMLERGASPEAIREDYPYLDEEDLEFARLFVRAYPKVGRPRETSHAVDR